jgi:hypothetical protein
MSPEDVAFLRKGSIMILPEDSYGRVVIFGDRSKWTPDVRSSAARSIFYIFQLAASSEIAQKHGCCFVFDCQKVDPNNFDRKVSRQVIQLIRECSAIRVRAIRGCYAAVKSPPALFRSSVLFMLGRSLRLRTCFHYGSPSELLWDLEQFGMLKPGLPRQVGGSYSFSDFETRLTEYSI